ncbi:hypothetical protein ACVWYH_009046 [Bradyrhizobium sp. GM24.11]
MLTATASPWITPAECKPSWYTARLPGSEGDGAPPDRRQTTGSDSEERQDRDHHVDESSAGIWWGKLLVFGVGSASAPIGTPLSAQFMN